MHVFVIVFQQFVQFIEELYFLLDDSDPSKIKLEEEQESKDTFSSDHDVLRFKQLVEGG